MKKLIAGSFILCLISVLQLNASSIEVCPSCSVSSLTEAIKIAKDGDRITIKKGLYKEHSIVIDKSLEIIGEEGAIIDGESQAEIITVIANDVTLRGLTIQNVGTSYTEDRAGIRIRKSRNFTIANNKLLNTFFGIYLEHSNYGRIIDNIVVGDAQEEMSSGNAIHLWYCKNIEVSGNQVSHHRDGIYFEFVDKSLVKNNVSHNNLRYGLHFMFSNNDDYFHNTFRNNGAGVAVMFSKFINMWENNFERNWGTSSYGLLLKEIYDAEILNNNFVGNTIGIYVEGSTRINYLKNNFSQNGWAIKISGGCLDNIISQNNFLSNTFDLSVKTNSSDNVFDGNYWSEYTGYDLDRDGIGDIPFRPVKLFNFVVDQTPESLVLLRSLFVDLINFAEKVSPVFTPKKVMDHNPRMKKINFDTE